MSVTGDLFAPRPAPAAGPPGGVAKLLARDEVLADARREFRARIGDGATCPVCDRHAREYRRPLTRAMVEVLAWVYRLGVLRSGSRAAPAPIHVTRELLAVGRNAVAQEYSKLRFWELLAPVDGAEGMWRVTPLGVEFLEGRASVPAHVVIFDNTRVRVDDRRIRVDDALGVRFDLDALLAGAAGGE